MLVAKLEARYEAEAKERQAATQLSGKDKAGSPVFGGGNVATTDPGKTRDHLGALAGVSGRTYDKAKTAKNFSRAFKPISLYAALLFSEPAFSITARTTEQWRHNAHFTSHGTAPTTFGDTLPPKQG